MRSLFMENLFDFLINHYLILTLFPITKTMNIYALGCLDPLISSWMNFDLLNFDTVSKITKLANY